MPVSYFPSTGRRVALRPDKKPGANYLLKTKIDAVEAMQEIEPTLSSVPLDMGDPGDPCDYYFIQSPILGSTILFSQDTYGLLRVIKLQDNALAVTFTLGCITTGDGVVLLMDTMPLVMKLQVQETTGIIIMYINLYLN